MGRETLRGLDTGGNNTRFVLFVVFMYAIAILGASLLLGWLP